ncbi:MAG TPA: dienelactone hydrolase family protein [Phycisphaerales bacterium]|nr:dienelactone hydrolase family protein [Phycisphaerales bacterium]
MLTRCVALLAATVSTAAMAEIKVERIEYTHGAAKLEGVLAYDDAMKPGEKRPGVLVCHEWWGNNEYSESRAKQLAQLGYVAFALDMYGKGKATKDPRQASEWMGELMSDQKHMRDRAEAGLAVLADNPRTDSANLAVVGYCMGGTVALELARSGARHTEHLKAVVPFHASTLKAANPADNANIKGTVLVCHGQDDTFVKPEQIAGFHEQMTGAGIDYFFISFAHAVHAFTNPDADKAGVPGVRYNEKADKRSWAAMKNLLGEVFGAKPKAGKPRAK